MASGAGLKNKSSRVVIRYLADRRDVIPTVASWIYREWSFLYKGKTSRHVERFLQERLHKKKLPITFVAYAGKEPAGTVSLKEFDMETRPELSPWVTSLYVVEEFRGRGIGGQLMKAVEQKAAGLGIKKLFLFTADPGLAARFYSRLGWKIKEGTDYHSYGVIIMEKRVLARGKDVTGHKNIPIPKNRTLKGHNCKTDGHDLAAVPQCGAKTVSISSRPA